jgi:hypothetical protein
MKSILFSCLIAVLFAGCKAELQTLLEQSAKPTNAEMIGGLKEALKTGAIGASEKLGKTGGFSASEIYRIALPKEAEPITKNIALVPGGQKLLNDAITRINRAAERASGKAAPIFTEAISQMSIADAAGILKGRSGTATEYLDQKTRAKLKAAFAPDIKEALNERLIAGASAKESWDTLANGYNKAANSLAGKAAKLSPVQTDLEDYVLDKALSAIFSEIAVKEKEIRENPLQSASDLVRKVFAYAKNGY